MAFSWDKASRQYLDADGAPVPDATVRDWVKDAVTSGGEALARLARRYQSAEINLPEWTIAAGDEVKQMHRALAMIAFGGRAQMSASEWGKVGSILRREYGYLNGFVNEIENLPKDAELTDGFIARAKSYASAGYSTYQNLIRVRERDAGQLYERLVLGAAEHCEDCVRDSERGEVEIGTLAPIGSRQCITNCRCYFEYSGGEEVEI